MRTKRIYIPLLEDSVDEIKFLLIRLGWNLIQKGDYIEVTFPESDIQVWIILETLNAFG